TVEAEAVVEALGNHDLPTQYISVLHEFRAIPFRPKHPTKRPSENIMRCSVWGTLGVKVDGRYLHHPRLQTQSYL
ncbi:hypothetical protein V3C99_015272, partial [Haemonchus contortus]